MKKVKVIEVQGTPHTLTQKNGKTFRLFARQTKVIDESLISDEFLAEQKMGNIIITPVKTEEKIVEKTTKGGTK